MLPVQGHAPELRPATDGWHNAGPRQAPRRARPSWLRCWGPWRRARTSRCRGAACAVSLSSPLRSTCQSHMSPRVHTLRIPCRCLSRVCLTLLAGGRQAAQGEVRPGGAGQAQAHDAAAATLSARDHVVVVVSSPLALLCAAQQCSTMCTVSRMRLCISECGRRGSV